MSDLNVDRVEQLRLQLLEAFETTRLPPALNKLLADAAALYPTGAVRDGAYEAFVLTATAALDHYARWKSGRA